LDPGLQSVEAFGMDGQRHSDYSTTASVPPWHRLERIETYKEDEPRCFTVEPFCRADPKTPWGSPAATTFTTLNPPPCHSTARSSSIHQKLFPPASWQPTTLEY